MGDSTELTQARLLEVAHYDPETGVFVSRMNRRRCRDGAVLGYTRGNVLAYLHTMIDRRSYSLHRLAFLYMTGSWPKGHVDHINGEPADNRWSNLRDVSVQMNIQNQRKPMTTNKLGVLGVVYEGGRYRAAVHCMGVNVRRSFRTLEEASTFYVETKRRIHAGCTL